MAPTPSAKSKSANKTKIITLRLTKVSLSRFPSDVAPSAVPSSPSSSAVGSNAPATATASTPDPTGTAVDGSNLLVPPDSQKRKGVPGPKPGMKRNASQITLDGLLKPRGKPGPKKKMRMDGANGHLVPVNAPKINPKASAGAINANLRALDRTGRPCRRWHREPFAIKSFTGSAWIAGAWGAPQRPKLVLDEKENHDEHGQLANGDAKSDVSVTPSELAGKHSRLENARSHASDEKSNGGSHTPMPATIQHGEALAATEG